MTWELRIHHLDINWPGDATIIQAVSTANNVQTIRTVLIDGGKAAAGAIVHDYLVNLGVAALDVIAVTHPDDDHMCGITTLLDNTDTKLYDNTTIYDLGEPHEKIVKYNKRKPDGTLGPSAPYTKYIDAINRVNTRVRKTALVNSFDIVLYDKNGMATIPRKDVVTSVTRASGSVQKTFKDPAHLVGQEIMWTGMTVPSGAPTIKCVAANKYVLQADGTKRYLSAKTIYDGTRMSDSEIAEMESKHEGNENAKSLAFLIVFNNFRYYVGGDLESDQEDGCINKAAGAFQPGLMALFNPNGLMSGRVLAMKASHHGSNVSSSRAFIDQLRPSATFISTGKKNKHEHPGQATVNVLDGYRRSPILGDPKKGDRHPLRGVPPAPFQGPTRYYLTSWYDDTPNTYGGDRSMTAGDPKNSKPGHIVLSVTEDQSNRPVVGQTYRGIHAAVETIRVAMNASVVSTEIADAGATYGTAHAAAKAVGGDSKAVDGALNAAAWLGDNEEDEIRQDGVITSALKDNFKGGAAAVKAAKCVEAPGGQDNRVSKIGKGVGDAVGWVVCGSDATKIEQEALTGGASSNAAKAAAIAATAGWPDVEDAAYAAGAAMGAVYAGASVAVAVTIAVAMAATVADASALDIATYTTKAAIAANVSKPLAAVAGAAAAASWWAGDMDKVEEATRAALIAAGYSSGPHQAGAKAKMDATLSGGNTLFEVTYFDLATGKDETIAHS